MAIVLDTENFKGRIVRSEYEPSSSCSGQGNKGGDHDWKNGKKSTGGFCIESERAGFNVNVANAKGDVSVLELHRDLKRNGIRISAKRSKAIVSELKKHDGDIPFITVYAADHTGRPYSYSVIDEKFIDKVFEDLKL